ncbi:MAG TPA: FAD-dependent oxidoreductase [Saprospiraceae bacterium]|nr:FAD-dependent oxidoreductase [Saprospiraceae bacterium]
MESNQTLSYWEQLLKDDPGKIVIIGSGITGLTTAIYLKEMDPLQEVMIVERGVLPSGASTKNAGFACFGSVSELLDDLKKVHPEQVESVIRMRYKGLEKLFSLIDKDDIDYVEEGGYEVFFKGDEKILDKCLHKIDLCNEMVLQATGLENVFKVKDGKQCPIHTPLPFIYNPHEAKLDPVKLIKALQKKAVSMGVFILTGINIVKINRNDKQLLTEDLWKIPYSKLVLCNNGFVKGLLPDVDIYPARNQVYVTGVMEDLHLPGCYHYNKGFVYFREIHQRILIGGGRDRDISGETTLEMGNTKVIREYLETFLKENILRNKPYTIDHSWSGILGLGPVKEPVIARWDHSIYVGVRLGGMGIALGSEVGSKLARLVLL